MFKRFDEILSIQQDFIHKVKSQKLYVDDMPDGELPQFVEITNMMMESTIDYCGVKRGYL